jgi:hypothetical protein
MIHSLADVPELLFNSAEQGGLVLSEADLPAAFFDLRTGFAGELFQKVANYRARLALVLHDPTAHGERFGELVHEHRNHPAIRFFADEAAAREWLLARG